MYACIAGTPRTGECPVKLFAATTCAAFAALLLATGARADQCDDILAALSKRADTLTKMDAKGGALCSGMGQLVGLMHAGRIVAEACSRDAAAKDMAESIKAMQEGTPAECK
jgi:hypothetical protein